MTKDKSGRTSAGILLWRRRQGRVEVLLAHQGGPFWAKKESGTGRSPRARSSPARNWSPSHGESSRKKPERGPEGPLVELGEIKQKSGKLVLGWAAEGDLDPSTAVSNTFDLEWPPHSGVVRSFPEIDRVEWFDLDEAHRRLKAAQVPFLDRLESALADAPPLDALEGAAGRRRCRARRAGTVAAARLR